MRIFDAHVRTDGQSDEDLQNLRYFDTERLVTTAHAYRSFERAEELLEYFEWLCGDERRRIERYDLEAFVALGVPPDARPRRRHPEVWTRMPELLERTEVVAVGEIGAWEDAAGHWELFNRQLKMARQADVAVIATPPEGLKVNMTYKMMMRVEDHGPRPERVMMNFLDERSIETVVRDGFVAGVAVGPANLDARVAAREIADAIQSVGHADRIVLNSALRAGSSDVLGIPKTVSALEDCGVAAETIEKLVWGNAVELFRL